MATVRMMSVREECPGDAEEIFNAVLVSAMAGCRAMAIIAGQDDDAAAVAQAVGAGMEAAGAVVMIAIAHPGATLRDLIDQVASPPVRGKGKGNAESKATVSASVPEGPEGLVTRLLQGEDAGLLIVAEAHVLEPEPLESVLSLSRVDLGDGRVLQVLLAGNEDLHARLDHRADQSAACHVLRWMLEPKPRADVHATVPAPPPTPALSRASSPAPADRTDRRSLRRYCAVGLLLIAATAIGWFAADRLLTEPPVATVEMPAINAPIAIAEGLIEPPSDGPSPSELIAATQSAVPPEDLTVSTDHGPKPTVRSGDTIVVQVETGADKFVYCYYMDSFQQVARIFPNRFQSDAFVPAGRTVQIPPGPELERPFNIRLDMAGRLEVVTCLASPTEIERSRIDGSDADDLTPIPGLGLQDLFDAFGRLSVTGARSQTMPINVVGGLSGEIN